MLFIKKNKFKLNTINQGNGLILLKSLPTNSTKLVFFDPQYSKVKDVIKVHQAPMIYQPPEQIQEFLKEIARVLKPSAFCLLWLAKRQVLNQSFSLPANLKVVDFLVWNKSPGMLMGSWLRNQAEFAYLIQKEPYNCKAFTDRSFGNVYQETYQTILKREHPHEKPLNLSKKLIEATTKKGDLIVDPCAGGFGILRACQELKRKFLGTDLSYYEVREYMEKAKNKKAKPMKTCLFCLL